MHCPKCGVEFVEGVTTCADCGIELTPATEAKYVEWVTVLAHRDYGRIGLAESILQAAEITYVTEGLYAFLAQLFEPMLVRVHAEDEERARKVLEELPAEM